MLPSLKIVFIIIIIITDWKNIFIIVIRFTYLNVSICSLSWKGKTILRGAAKRIKNLSFPFYNYFNVQHTFSKKLHLPIYTYDINLIGLRSTFYIPLGVTIKKCQLLQPRKIFSCKYLSLGIYYWYNWRIKARLNGFNICPTFVQQKLNGCWAIVGWTECSNGFNAIQHFQEQNEIMLNRCWMKV